MTSFRFLNELIKLDELFKACEAEFAWLWNNDFTKEGMIFLNRFL